MLLGKLKKSKLSINKNYKPPSNKDSLNIQLSMSLNKEGKINTNLLHERHVDVGKTRKARDQRLQSYAW
jgi:hypothetical protein